MALTQQPTYSVTLTLVDRDRNVSTMSVHIPTSSLIGAVESWVTGTLIPAVQGITNAVVQSLSISTSAVDDTAVALASEAADVERKGVFSFRAADGSMSIIAVPSINNTVVIDETNIIDKSNAAVIAFRDAILNTSGLLITASTYLASDLIMLEKAVKHHRGSSRG
jgi:hypothetical protein